jgi:hypothetical protein
MFHTTVYDAAFLEKLDICSLRMESVKMKRTPPIFDLMVQSVADMDSPAI